MDFTVSDLVVSASNISTDYSHISSLKLYRGADKSLAQPSSQCILFDGENMSFDASLVIYIYIYIQGVPAGMCQTSGVCSLC